jgi:hypothetical protein
MLDSIRQTAIFPEPAWQQAGTGASAFAASTVPAASPVSAGSSANTQQNALQDSPQLRLAYAELSELQEAANAALSGGNTARAMEAAMQATQVAASIRDIVGSAPAVSVGDLVVSPEQVSRSRAGSDQTAAAGGFPASTAGNGSVQAGSATGTGGGQSANDPATALKIAIDEAVAAFKTNHLDVKA